VKSSLLGTIIKTEIVRLARGGRAVGRHPDGRVIFVLGGVPGDVVEAEITLESERFLEAKVSAVLEASPFRVDPLCPHFENCGGCPWQNVSYDEQIKQKRAILKDTLVRGRALSAEEADKFQEFFSSPKVFRYRSRVTLQRRTTEQKSEIGFNRRESSEFVPINDCLIAREELIPFAKQIASNPESRVRDRFQVVVDESGKTHIGGAFTQVNLEQNKVLQQAVAELIASHIQHQSSVVHWHFLDLYCGDGNLTFPTIEKVREILPDKVIEATGVEQNDESIRDAKANPRAQMCRFYAEDVESWLTRQKSGPAAQLTKKGLTLDEIVLLDPPREGCAKGVVTKVARRKPGMIVYVSCDPVTQARDLARMRETFNQLRVSYAVEKIVGLDLFPQTDHIESIVALRRLTN
jgi:23S rRNA (uracil1939-C5)-methyltransferase